MASCSTDIHVGILSDDSCNSLDTDEGEDVSDSEFEEMTAGGSKENVVPKFFFECNLCEMMFNSNGHLIEHMMDHRKMLITRMKEDRKLKERPICQHCKKAMSSYTALIKHIRRVTGIKAYVCKLCKERFTLEKVFIRHQLMHQTGRSFVCDYCPKKFTTNSGRMRHQRQHTAEKPYVCTGCEKAFGQSNHMKRHMKSCKATTKAEET